MKLNPFYHDYRRGITLIELIVALGIVMILVLLIYPAIKEARSSASNAVCVSNLRTTGNMIQTLISDSNQRLVTRVGGNTLSGYYFWADNLWRKGILSPDGRAGGNPDENTVSVLRCPSAPFSSQAWYWYTYGLSMYDGRANIEMKGPKKDARIFELNVALVDNPSTYLLVADSINAAGTTQHTRIVGLSTAEGIELRHRGRANAYFLDGHIDALDRQAAVAIDVPYIYDVER